MTLAEAQKMVDHWITTIGVKYFSPLTNMAILAEETGEVARQMSRIYGDQSFKDGESANLGDELADLLWVTLAIANQCDIDMTAAFEANLLKKTQRDALRHTANEKLHKTNND
ncbi:MAG: nucleotide pyrophosphohydrolase [Muribaculaceae bacterium]|nr:nucleotide pyrophosphohydrolase [Muribaculaceae bacterium]